MDASGGLMGFVWFAFALTWLVCMPLRYRLEHRGQKAASLFCKAVPTAMAAALAGYAHFALSPMEPYSLGIFVGLCVCGLADVLLNVFLPLGGALFFAGHMCYVAAMGLYRAFTWWSLTACLLALAGLWLFGLRYKSLVQDRRLFWGMFLYAVALATLLGFSLPLPFLAPSKRSALADVGAALFVASDLMLCLNHVYRRGLPWRFASLGVYYAAQLLIGLSAFPIA